MKLWRILALHAGCLRLQTHTLKLCNTHCFSTASMVARTRLMLRYTYIACLVSSFLLCLFVCLFAYFPSLVSFYASSTFFFAYFFLHYVFVLYVSSYSLFFSFLFLLFPFLPCWCFLHFFLLLLILHICPHNCIIAAGGACSTYGDPSSVLRFW